MLVTLPGDEYEIHYLLPDDYSNYDYFLETQGYYYEWMRDNWLKEQNEDKVVLLLSDPEEFLKEAAPEYKKIEHTMDEIFWSSRYEK